jgi:hypothetical protein
MSRQLRPGQLRTGSFYDITASYALNTNTSALVTNRIAAGHITGSVSTGTASFLLTSASFNLFQITNTGVVIMATQSVDPPTGPVAPNGGMYFTSASFFVGLD